GPLRLEHARPHQIHQQPTSLLWREFSQTGDRMLCYHVEPGHLNVRRTENILNLLPRQSSTIHTIHPLTALCELSGNRNEVRIYRYLAVGIVELDGNVSRTRTLNLRAVLKLS